jgi:hypothetical protein
MTERWSFCYRFSPLKLKKSWKRLKFCYWVIVFY